MNENKSCITINCACCGRNGDINFPTEELEKKIENLEKKHEADLQELTKKIEEIQLPQLDGIMMSRRVLTAEDDLNNIKEIGIYLAFTGDLPQNSPFKNSFILEVCKVTGINADIQRATRYGADGHSAFRGTTTLGEISGWSYVSTRASDF